MKRKNFTLVELMVVLVVAGVLMTFAVPTYLNMNEEAKAKVCFTII